MPIDNPPPMYEIHDYSAVEEHITRQNERRVLANKSKNAAVFASYLKYGSLGIVALGVTAFLVLWGISLINEEKIQIVEKEVVVVEKATNFEVIPPKNFQTIPLQAKTESSAESLKMQERIQELERSLKSKSSNTGERIDKVDVVNNFIIFRSAKANVKGIADVTTGLKYKNSKQIFPFNQYCYVLKNNGGNKIWIDLASKTGRNPVIEVSFESVLNHGLSKFQYQELLGKCNFLND